MLKQLRIKNIVLVETAEIEFTPGFNVLTGETGAGKSAVIKSLNLLAGEKTDSSLIRHGTDKGYVEATFDIGTNSAAFKILDESGIALDPEEELIIKREISTAGKTRVFINQQQVQLGLLKQLNGILFEIVGQHANQRLFSVECHRQILDTYGSLENDIEAFSNNWNIENKLKKQLEDLLNSESQRVRQIAVYEMELEELDQARIKENEDDELFSEYTLLSNAEDLMMKSEEITQTLQGERHSVIPALNRLRAPFEQLIQVDPTLSETYSAFKNALIEIQEIAHTIKHYGSRIEHQPERTAKVSARLTLLDRLKKRFGPTLKDVIHYHTFIQEEMKKLSNADDQIRELKEQIDQVSKNSQDLSAKLTHNRKQAAAQLEQIVGKQLAELNMPKAQFFCSMTTQPRTSLGDDRVEFYLAPNVGESRVPVRECASGGEISRLLLALQAVTAGKAQIPTLIFDEIDANIGGATATVVAEKLRAIGKQHQLVSITHFPQVAVLADNHICIAKEEIEGRTFTKIDLLKSPEQKAAELQRMSGKVK